MNKYEKKIAKIFKMISKNRGNSDYSEITKVFNSLLNDISKNDMNIQGYIVYDLTYLKEFLDYYDKNRKDII